MWCVWFVLHAEYGQRDQLLTLHYYLSHRLGSCLLASCLMSKRAKFCKVKHTHWYLPTCALKVYLLLSRIKYCIIIYCIIARVFMTGQYKRILLMHIFRKMIIWHEMVNMKVSLQWKKRFWCWDPVNFPTCHTCFLLTLS